VPVTPRDQSPSRDLARSKPELARRNADLACFADRIAHDLRSPIEATKGFLALACGPFGGELTGQARACVEHAAAANDRTGQLIEGLLSYAAAGARARLEQVSLGDLVVASAIDVRELAASTEGRIDAAPLPTVDTDPTLLRRLLRNFISNALTYGRPGVRPVVRVDAEATSSGWWLSVSDNGRGIPPEEQAEVFGLLSRLPGGRDVPGSGIGLATCARIADTLGGRINIVSNNAGGTTFTLTVDRAG
jgi:signal transduction histidine kinase